MIDVEYFFDPETSTLSYVVFDRSSKDALCIDPVWNLDLASGRLTEKSLDTICSFLKKQDLNLKLILETHAHADHLTGAQLLKKKFPNVPVAIGENICEVQRTFKKIFNLETLATDGSQFDRLLKDGERVSAGFLSFEVRFTPGHTPACSSYLFESHVFVGDLLFMPDSGTGRCDFPGGDADTLYNSIHSQIYTLNDEVLVMTGHDYQPGGRELKFSSTVKEQKQNNLHIKASTSNSEFVKFRTERDKTLSAPKLLLPSLQINIRGGHLPEPEPNGVSYLKIPLS